MPLLSSSVVIATRNRAEPLRECLESIAQQTRVPCEVILVDASDDLSTAELAGNLKDRFTCPVRYLQARARSLVIQRWQGIEIASGDLIIFLDDDLVLEPSFISEIARVFEEDKEGDVGGVSGAMIGNAYAPPSRLNRLFLRLFVGKEEGSYAGRSVGPAVSFFPADAPDVVQRAEWLLGGLTGYRRELLLAEPCWESFSGYSFMEDVHLSARIGRKYRLLNTTRARVVHRGMGTSSHTDWAAFGESMVLNRHAVTMHVLQRRRLRDYARLLGYELLYCTAGQIKNPTRPWRASLQLLWGKLRGVGKLLRGKSPHRPYFGQAPAAEGARGIQALRRAFQVRKTSAFKAAKTPERADGDQ
jgi:glycosyltransferase involved in cell wall biosynthesis